MNIIIEEGFPEIASKAISAMAVILNEAFGSYLQLGTLELSKSVRHGGAIVPLTQYKKDIVLKTKTPKTIPCNCVFTVFSKYPETPYECARMIVPSKHVEEEVVFEHLSNAIKDALFDSEETSTFMDLLYKLEGVESDRKHFYYTPTACEDGIIHCVAVIHEFGQENNPYCVVTAYFPLKVSK